MKPLIFFLLLACLSSIGRAQVTDDLNFEEENIPIRNAFNSSYIINSQSTNILSPGRLNMLISHRFGTLNQGPFHFFGLDYGAMRLGFEYGINQRLTVGLGRSSVGKNFDTFFKYRLLTQTRGSNPQMPFSVVWFSSAAFSSVELRNRNLLDEGSRFSDCLVYTHQVLISHQFSSKFSLQLTPSLVHRNIVKFSGENNDVFSLGLGGRWKVSRRMHLLADYAYVFNHHSEQKLTNPLAIGIDIVAGGHVFQLHLNNALGMIEKEFLTTTDDDFLKGDIRIGFTILRSFMLAPEVKGGKIY